MEALLPSILIITTLGLVLSLFLFIALGAMLFRLLMQQAATQSSINILDQKVDNIGKLTQQQYILTANTHKIITEEIQAGMQEGQEIQVFKSADGKYTASSMPELLDKMSNDPNYDKDEIEKLKEMFGEGEEDEDQK